MEDIKEQQSTEVKPKRRKRRLLLWTILSLLSLTVFLQLVFLFFSDQLFGRLLKQVVSQGSNGIYVIEYDDVRFNVFKNEIEFYNVHLISDSLRFAQLDNKDNRTNRLYDFKSPHISIQGPSFIKLYFDKILIINEFVIEQPDLNVRIYGVFRKGQQGLRNFHEVLSNYISFFKIQSLVLTNGSVAINAITDTKRLKYKINEINTAVEGFVLNKSNENDSLLALSNLSLSLGKNKIRLDSLNFLDFESLSFSTKDSIIGFENVSLIPKKLVKYKNQPSFTFNDLELKGVDFPQMYFNNNFNARIIVADSGNLSYQIVSKPDSLQAWLKIETLFDTISVDQIVVMNTLLHYEKIIGKKQPKLDLPINKLSLQYFLLDSSSFFNNKKYFYSKHLDLALNEFDLPSKDNSQVLTVESLNLSTLRREMLLFNVSIASMESNGKKAAVDGNIRSVQFFGLDPLLAVQNNEIIARAVLIEKPTLLIKQGSEPTSGFSTNSLNTLVKKQFKRVHISNVEVENANIDYFSALGTKTATVNNAKLYCNNFKTYPGLVPAKNQLLSEWYSAEVASGYLRFGDNLHIGTVKNLRFFSQKGGVYCNELKIEVREGLSDSSLAKENVIKSAEFFNLNVEGFNAEKLAQENILEVEYLEAKGLNKLVIELGKKARGKSKIWAFDIKELNIDSIDASLLMHGTNESVLMGNGLVFQTCDFYWDTTFQSGTFNTYSILLEGNNIRASNTELAHVFKANKMKLNSSYNLFQFNGIDYRPFSDKYQGKTALWFSSPITRFSGIDLPLFFKTRQLRAENFYSSKPQIAFHSVENEEDGFAELLLNPFERTKELFNTAHIGSARVHEAKLHLTQHSGTKETEFNFDDLMLYMEDFKIDSYTVQTEKNIFFAQKTEIEFKNYEQRANDTSMVLSIGGSKLYPHKKKAVFENVELRNRKPAGTLGHFSVKADLSTLNKLNYHSFLVKKNIEMQKAEFDNASLTVGLRNKTANNQTFFESEIPKALTKSFGRIYSDSLVLNHSALKINYRDKASKTIKTEVIDGWDVNFQVFEVNRNFSQLNFLYSRAISAELSNYKYNLSDGLNTVKIGRLFLDISRGRINIDSAALSPRYSKELYAATYGKQIDRIEVYNQNSIIENFNFKEWLYNGRYMADKLHLNRTEVGIFTDKMYQEDKVKVKEMPQEILKNLPIELIVKETFINSWSIRYEEKVSNTLAPGIIYFNDFHGSISCFTNISGLADTTTTVLKLKTGLMKNGKVNLLIKVPLIEPDNTFTFKGDMNGMDMREINPLLRSLVKIEITEGQTYGMNFFGTANRYYAYGEVDLRYSDLTVNVIDESGGVGLKQKVLKFLANNFIIRQANRRFPRNGKIDFVRNENKSIFNYGAKALLTGIKESIGLKNKEGIDSVKDAEADKAEVKDSGNIGEEVK